MDGNTSNPARSRAISYFLSMGFEEDVVLKSVDLHAEGNYTDDSEILNTILAFQKSSEDDEKKQLQLMEMGFTAELVRRAIFDCVAGTSIPNLINYINALQDGDSSVNPRKRFKRTNEVEEIVRVPRQITEVQRKLYFYVESSALPKGGSVHGVKAEIVDSKFFSSAGRQRGFIHNLETVNRSQLIPSAPLTIKDSLPFTKKWWPLWDSRSQFNCLLTYIKLEDPSNITKSLECFGEDLSPDVTRNVLFQCDKWNVIWIGKNKVRHLEPEEIEVIMGYPLNHTRVGGVSSLERLKALRNSFQVDTLAYQLSIFRNRFPHGISVLSIFSGIGGAEIALDRLGVPLRYVVAVESSKANREIYRNWWQNTRQKGELDDSITDLKFLTREKLKSLVNHCGGFDLIVGGTPCTNQPGIRKETTDGYEVKMPVITYDFCQILDIVKDLMSARLS